MYVVTKKKREKLREMEILGGDSVFALNAAETVTNGLWLSGDSHIFLISTQA